MTAFATQTDIQMTGAGLLGSDVSGSSRRMSKRITIGSGLTLSGGVLSNSLDLSGYLPLSGGTLSGALSLGSNGLTSGTITASGPASLPALLFDGRWSSDPTKRVVQIRVDSSGNGELSLNRSNDTNGMVWASASGGFFQVAANGGFYFSESNNSATGQNADVLLRRGGAGILEQRNGLNSQCYDLFETYTSDTNNGKLRFKATSSGHQIGSARATSGSNRAVHIGHFNSSDVFSSAMSVGTDGIVTLTANMTLDPSGLVTARSVQMGLIATTATATRGILNGAATKVYLGGSTSNDTIIGALSRADITIAGATGVATFGSAIVPATLTDAAAPNGAIYYSSTQSKLVYKDSGGTVNVLY